MGEIKKDDSKYLEHRDDVRYILGTKDGHEIGVSIWRMKPFKKIWDVLLMDKLPASKEEFEVDGLFNKYVGFSRFEGLRRIKRGGSGQETIMTVIKADSTIASYIKELASEKKLNWADKLEGGAFLSPT